MIVKIRVNRNTELSLVCSESAADVIRRVCNQNDKPVEVVNDVTPDESASES